MISIEKKFDEPAAPNDLVPVTILVSNDGRRGAYISIQVGFSMTTLHADVIQTTTGERVEVTEVNISEG